MADRRPLVAGLSPIAPQVDPAKEKAFVFQEKTETSTDSNQPPQASSTTLPARTFARVPLSTRMRSDFATALKRASLERQLAGVEPNTLQDMLEQAVEPWLRNNGYLK
jgi:hypothetical protein